jgi:hypothetical protein
MEAANYFARVTFFDSHGLSQIRHWALGGGHGFCIEKSSFPLSVTQISQHSFKTTSAKTGNHFSIQCTFGKFPP